MRYAALRLGGKWASADIRLPASLEGTVVLVAPIWDGRLAPPAQKALEQINRADTVLVTLSKRSVLRDAMGCKVQRDVFNLRRHSAGHGYSTGAAHSKRLTANRKTGWTLQYRVPILFCCTAISG